MSPDDEGMTVIRVAKALIASIATGVWWLVLRVAPLNDKLVFAVVAVVASVWCLATWASTVTYLRRHRRAAPRPSRTGPRHSRPEAAHPGHPPELRAGWTWSEQPPQARAGWTPQPPEWRAGSLAERPSSQ